MEEWAQGFHTSEDGEGTLQKNSHAIGRVSMIDEIIEDIREKGEESGE